MESEEDLAARLTERLPIEEAEECLCQLEEHCITVGVLGEADAQDLADELGFTERQCDAVLLDDEAWQARYGQGQADAPGVQQANANMAVQEPSGEATPDSNLAENDPGVSSVPDSCDGDGPLLQVSSHRRCAYRSANARARLTPAQRAPPPRPGAARSQVLAGATQQPWIPSIPVPEDEQCPRLEPIPSPQQAVVAPLSQAFPSRGKQHRSIASEVEVQPSRSL